MISPILLLALTAPPDADDPLPPRAVARLGPQRFQLNRGVIGGFAISPGGHRIATPGPGGTVILDTATGRVVARYSVRSCLAYSPDGRTLAALGPAVSGHPPIIL